jgi:hypothetical protein
MQDKNPDRLTKDLEDALHRYLSGDGRDDSRPAGPVPTHGGVRARASTSAIRVEPLTSTVVVVAVHQDAHVWSPDQLRELARPALAGHLPGPDTPLSVYCVVPGRHWGALESWQLNPDDGDHLRFLRNLMPDFVLLPPGTYPPSWCSEATKTVVW